MSGGLTRRLVAEAVGTALLLATVVGSGIMAERLFEGDPGLTLLANSLATGAALLALILTFGPVSGGHFNPAVTVAEAAGGNISARDGAAYVATQTLGAILGVWTAHMMFGEPVLMVSDRARHGTGQWAGEFVATFGLVAVITGCAHRRVEVVAMAVAAYITAAYWFTSSTSFANPAVTVARALTDTFAGIRPADVPVFVLVQLVGGLSGARPLRWLP